MNARAVVQAVKSLDHKGLRPQAGGCFRKPPDLAEVNKRRVGHVDANAPGQLHHGALVFRNILVDVGRKFGDPRTANTVGRNGEATGRPLDGREF
jgi:hypothetical protein